MHNTDESKFMAAERAKYLTRYGDVPPHWIVFDNTHPYSIQWRMGSGETFVSVFMDWFESQYETAETRIAYFRKYPPPPRWLGIVAELIWDLDPVDEPDFDYQPWMEKLAALGFAGTQDFEADLDDEKWLQIEAGEAGPD